MDLQSLRWQGYRRQDGSLGIRNKVLVVYTVECARFVAEEIARRSGDPETEVIGFSGCTDNAYAIRLLLALIR
ncbi:MAG: UxaA family hydrolase, partial [Lawsonibacter sp.]